MLVEPLFFFFFFFSIFQVLSKSLNPFGSTLLQIADFFEVSGADCCLNP